MADNRNVRDVVDVRCPTYGPDSCRVVIHYGSDASGSTRVVTLHLDGSTLCVLVREGAKALQEMVTHAQSNLSRAGVRP